MRPLFFVLAVSLSPVAAASDAVAVSFEHWLSDPVSGCQAKTVQPFPADALSMTWSGACVDGKTSGAGILQLRLHGKQWDRYEGSMAAGRRHGRGLYVEAFSGRRIEGEWKEDVGVVEATFPDGGRYRGDWRGYGRHGRGAMTWPGGHTYEGEWADDARSGEGTFTTPGGEQYRGYWTFDKPSGFGAYTNASGKKHNAHFGFGCFSWESEDIWIDTDPRGSPSRRVDCAAMREGYAWLSTTPCSVYFPARYPETIVDWRGACLGGRAQGPGVLDQYEGWVGLVSRYTGEMHNGRRHGFGTLKQVLGPMIYAGEWRDDLRHGHGASISEYGDRYKGEFRGDKREGRGVLTWQSGDRYEGDFLRDNPHGRGVRVWSDGDRYDGEWSGGYRSGSGAMTWASGARYEGRWARDRVDGQGAYTTPAGESVVGLWSNGCLRRDGRWIAVGTTVEDCASR